MIQYSFVRCVLRTPGSFNWSGHNSATQKPGTEITKKSAEATALYWIPMTAWSLTALLSWQGRTISSLKFHEALLVILETKSPWRNSSLTENDLHKNSSREKKHFVLHSYRADHVNGEKKTAQPYRYCQQVAKHSFTNGSHKYLNEIIPLWIKIWVK